MILQVVLAMIALLPQMIGEVPERPWVVIMYAAVVARSPCSLYVTPKCRLDVIFAGAPWSEPFFAQRGRCHKIMPSPHKTSELCRHDAVCARYSEE